MMSQLHLLIDFNPIKNELNSTGKFHKLFTGANCVVEVLCTAEVVNKEQLSSFLPILFSSRNTLRRADALFQNFLEFGARQLW
jgi:hypothetical protein